MKKTDHCIQAKVAPSEEKLGLNSSHEMPVQLKKTKHEQTYSITIIPASVVADYLLCNQC